MCGGGKRGGVVYKETIPMGLLHGTVSLRKERLRRDRKVRKLRSAQRSMYVYWSSAPAILRGSCVPCLFRVNSCPGSGETIRGGTYSGQIAMFASLYHRPHPYTTSRLVRRVALKDTVKITDERATFIGLVATPCIVRFGTRNPPCSQPVLSSTSMGCTEPLGGWPRN